MRSNSPPAQIVDAVARLLSVPASRVNLKRLQQGLSHYNFDCRVDSARYFVKVYALGPDSGSKVRQINLAADTMRKLGVPAPELVAYSRRFPNVVIHRFVDAAQISWDPVYIAPVASLYSHIAAYALQKPVCVPRSTYIRDLQRVADSLARLPGEPDTPTPDTATRALDLCRQVIRELNVTLAADQLLALVLHDDFTENNILGDGGQIRLICDWDSYRLSLFLENLACSAVRFSTSAPLQGELHYPRLQQFLSGLSEQVLKAATDQPGCLKAFPYLAVLRHLRTYPFRSRVVASRRPELEASLLVRPVEHCEWMIANASRISARLDVILHK